MSNTLEILDMAFRAFDSLLRAFRTSESPLGSLPNLGITFLERFTPLNHGLGRFTPLNRETGG